MALVKGRNGVVFEVLDSAAASLVAAGDAEYVERPKNEPAKRAKKSEQ